MSRIRRSHDLVVGVTWQIRTHVWVTRLRRSTATWLRRMRESCHAYDEVMTSSYAWHDSLLWHMSDITHIWVTWLTLMTGKSYEGHDSVIWVTWLRRMSDMTPSSDRCNSFMWDCYKWVILCRHSSSWGAFSIWVTWLLRIGITLSYETAMKEWFYADSHVYADFQVNEEAAT